MALFKMPKIRKTIPLPKMRIYWALGAFTEPFLFVFKYVTVTYVSRRASRFEVLRKRTQILPQLFASFVPLFLLPLDGKNRL
jgi:hypothetical protein